MKLYRVETYGVLYVQATDGDDAIDIARRVPLSEYSSGLDLLALEANRSETEPDWLDAHPFKRGPTNAGDPTIRELFARGEIET